MVEIILRADRELREELQKFEAALLKMGMRIIKQQLMKYFDRDSGKLELTINAKDGEQAKSVHRLACQTFGRSYVCLSLAA